LKDLGGLAELEDAGDEIVIRGFSCPLASVVKEHPEVCQLAETVMAVWRARAGGVCSQWRTHICQTEQIVQLGRISGGRLSESRDPPTSFSHQCSA
jgi:hypothetical protein